MFAPRIRFLTRGCPPTLRHRDFRLFTIGYLLAETGEYIDFVVQNWLAWELTRLAFSLGLLGFCEFASRIVCGPIGGVVADRMDRIQLLKLNRLANLIQTLIFAALIFTGLLQFWHMVVWWCSWRSSARSARQLNKWSSSAERRSATARGWRDQLGRMSRS